MEFTGNETVRIWKSTTITTSGSTIVPQLWNDTEVEDFNLGINWAIPIHCLTIGVWQSEAGKAELTVPDLADSIEAMLARRESGLPAPTTVEAMRQYPTDPSTQRSATAFLKQIQEDGKKEMQELDAQYKESKQAKAEAKAKAEAEQKAFAEFKATQQAKTS